VSITQTQLNANYLLRTKSTKQPTRRLLETIITHLREFHHITTKLLAYDFKFSDESYR